METQKKKLKNTSESKLLKIWLTGVPERENRNKGREVLWNGTASFPGIKGLTRSLAGKKQVSDASDITSDLLPPSFPTRPSVISATAMVTSFGFPVLHMHPTSHQQCIPWGCWGNGWRQSCLMPTHMPSWSLGQTLKRYNTTPTSSLTSPFKCIINYKSK